jgi:methionyl-tRNA formyltransferase
LAAFKLGIINIHFSLLPAYRGAAPVQQALFDGQTKTGVSAFWIDEGLDTGPIALRKTVDILPQDDAATLFPKLTAAGLETLQNLIKDLEAGKITKTPQQGAPSFAPLISKEKTFVSFSAQDAGAIHNLARGLASGMPAYAKALTPSGQTVQILKTALNPCPAAAPKARPGALIYIESNGGCFVQCEQGVLYINDIRPAGKNIMTASAYANGRKLGPGAVIFK